MDTKEHEGAGGSSDSRSDLAMRGATAEQTPRRGSKSQNPTSPKISHSRGASLSALQSAQKQEASGTIPKNMPPSGAPSGALSGTSSGATNKPPSAPSGSLPEFMIKRNELFDKLKRERDREIREREKPAIDVVLDLGTDEGGNPRPKISVSAKAWETTPGLLLREVPKDVSADVVVAKIDGKELWDLDRPLEYACTVKYLPFTSEEGRKVFWHSSAHILGEACECQYQCLLSHGPPVDAGFFYDQALADGQAIGPGDYKPLEDRATKIVKEKQQFERLHVSLANLKEMFGYSKYKMYYIENLLPPEGSTVYRNGTLVDLCLGPHIQNTSKIKAFKIMKNSSCYFRGDKNDDTLQRIYGVAFPDKKLMTEHQKFLEEAAKRDHRKIGLDQELFMFSELSPGSAFLLPNGTLIFNALQKMLREKYHKYRYHEVQTPNMYDVDLWKTSGHWQHYQDDMFTLDVEKRKWALKPMNCPGHCLIFKHRDRSYRELPLRIADFGVLHRNEASGALHGMTRVRRFQQDDAHIFCTHDQIEQEIEGLFSFLKETYSLFGFAFKLKLSTRPEKYLGDIETWDTAEAQLKDSLNKFQAAGNGEWELNEGDGAFYGPKIDIEISDALKRDFQCATIQLDFQLPQSFELEYTTAEISNERKDGQPSEIESHETTASAKSKQLGQRRARPVMLHRAIIGSFERFMAIITEHFAGKWPFWLSPRQVLVIPVTPVVNAYAEEVKQLFWDHDMFVDVDTTGNTLPKKIRTGWVQQYNFIFVVGAQEEQSRSVNIRNRDDTDSQAKGDMISLQEVIQKLEALKNERRMTNSI